MVKKTAKTEKVKKSVAAKVVPVKKAVKTVVKPASASTKPVSKVKTANPVLKKTIAPVKNPPVKGIVAKPVVVERKSPVDAKALAQLKDALIKMRDRLTGQISSQSVDSLKYVDDTSSEDRTDDFDKEFALNLVSSEHDSVFEIDNALRRITEGSYGFCDGCGCAIEKPRLHALPFARMCIRCQSEQEKGRTRFRPFGDTLAQGVEQTPDVSEPEETE